MTAPAWPDTTSRADRPHGLRIVITGASGTVGSRVTRLLAADHQVRSLTRDPARAAGRGVAGQIVRADLADRTSLKETMTGADALLLVTFDPAQPAHDVNALSAAQATGVRHIVKLSASAVDDPGSQDLITNWQRECEERLKLTGLSWTLLRSRAYMSNSLGWSSSIRQEGVVRSLYGSSQNACIDPQDVAEAAARALTAREHAAVHALTGPEALSAQEQTRQLAKVLGRPLRYEEMTEEQALQGWARRFPKPVAGALLTRARRQAEGVKAQPTSGVVEAIGRPMGTFLAWAARHTADFR
ncbi:NAD(P)H-binding protein [Streptomyces sp. NPDC058622]|uniref:NAD(P)H-binding protein n=1 Tax=Streptomyces sp. NPDC058622 TaxID=3346562 RepID=UPI003660E41C